MANWNGVSYPWHVSQRSVSNDVVEAITHTSGSKDIPFVVTDFENILGDPRHTDSIRTLYEICLGFRFR